ncbi:MAG: hypothetical protein ACI9C9_001280, partial [Marivirga sp.]
RMLFLNKGQAFSYTTHASAKSYYLILCTI